MNCTQRTGHSFGWLIVISHPEKAERELREGPKWRGLEHNGLCFPPDYELLTAEVKFVYDGIKMSLSRQMEENPTLYANETSSMAQDPVFINSFFSSFRQGMTEEERDIILDFDLCNFLTVSSRPPRQQAEDRGGE